MSDIRCENVTFKYPGSSNPVLRSIDLTIPKGEFVLVAGPSGCGKSTLGLAIAGLIPTRIPGRLEGGVFFGGKNISRMDIHEVSQQIGIVFQNPDNQLIHLDVESEVAFGPENLGISPEQIRTRVDESLRQTGMYGITSQIHELSGGQKQRVAISATLAMNPQVLVLDEPTSDLDPVGTQEVLKVLQTLNRERGTTIILVEHKIDEVIPWVDRVILMDQGAVVSDGPPRSVFAEREKWVNLGVAIPDVVELAHAIPQVFRGRIPLTVQEANDALRDSSYASNLKCFSSVNPGGSSLSPVDGGLGPHPLLEWEQVQLTYGEKPVLKDVNLRVQSNEWVALLGPNGSGKTSLASLAMGFQKPSAGTVRFAQSDVLVGDISRQAKDIAYLFQAADNMLFTPTVKQELLFGVKHRRKNKLNQMNQSLDSLATTTDLLSHLHHNPFQLSHGQRKRLAIGALLAASPKMMILDEPTTGQDEGHARALLEFLQELRQHWGLSYLMITHDMHAAARYADRIVVLNDGHVQLSGSPDRVFARVDELASCSILPPSIARLHAMLCGEQVQRVCLSVSEFVNVIQRQEVSVG